MTKLGVSDVAIPRTCSSARWPSRSRQPAGAHDRGFPATLVHTGESPPSHPLDRRERAREVPPTPDLMPDRRPPLRSPPSTSHPPGTRNESAPEWESESPSLAMSRRSKPLPAIHLAESPCPDGRSQQRGHPTEQSGLRVEAAPRFPDAHSHRQIEPAIEPHSPEPW